MMRTNVRRWSVKGERFEGRNMDGGREHVKGGDPSGSRRRGM